MDPVVACLVVVVIVVGIGAEVYRTNRRTKEIKAFAEYSGYTYQKDPQLHLPGAVWRFPLFTKGQWRSSRNLIQKQMENGTVSIMDYTYKAGSLRNRQIHKQTVIIFDDRTLDLPEFSLKPEQFHHKVGKFFGVDDINFDSFPNFSRRYRLIGPNETRIRECFHETLLSFVESQDKLYIEANGPLFICYFTGKLKAPKFWQTLIATGFQTYENFT